MFLHGLTRVNRNVCSAESIRTIFGAQGFEVSDNYTLGLEVQLLQTEATSALYQARLKTTELM